MLKPCLVSLVVSAAVAVFVTGVVSGQDYPSKPIRIVTVAAGGSGDFASRLVGQEISGPLGQPVIVDNRTSTVVALEVVMKAPPDGYVLLEGGGSTLWISPFMRENIFWDPVRDFSPITLVEKSPLILIVHPSLPAKSVAELIALAKAKPGAINYASGTQGSSAHLAGELFKAMAGVNLVAVPYKGSVPAIQGVMGGEVQVTFAGGGGVAPFLKTGKLRALASTGLRPSALAPGLPLVAESGVPGFEVVAIDVFFAPAKTPAAIINRLNQEIVRVLSRADTKERLLSVGVEVATSTPEELAATVKSEMTKWGKLIKDIGLRLD